MIMSGAACGFSDDVVLDCDEGPMTVRVSLDSDGARDDCFIGAFAGCLDGARAGCCDAGGAGWFDAAVAGSSHKSISSSGEFGGALGGFCWLNVRRLWYSDRFHDADILEK